MFRQTPEYSQAKAVVANHTA